MPQKMLLSLEERIKAVEDCINGKESINSCAKKYGIGYESLRCWIRLYKTRGFEGIIPSKKIKKYSAEIKQCAVNDYLTGKGSLTNICIKYDISSHSMLQSWIKRYNGHGKFKQPNMGGESYMTKGRKTTQEERVDIVSHCIANNKDYGKTIDQYSVSYQQIYGWVNKYEKNGVSGLVDRRGKRKNEDIMTEVEKLKAQLKLNEAENLRLQMENELLKKLEALERGIDAN
jgi:transposase-like protein